MTTKPLHELFKPLEPRELPPLRPKPAYYQDVLVFSSQGGPASIGGPLGIPDLSLSYLLAARHVIEGALASARLSEVALPAAYLQRHAVEVELKDIIRSARGIAGDNLWWDLLDKDEKAEPPPFVEPANVHWFDELLVEAEAALQTIDFDKLPDQLHQMCAKLTNLEKREGASKSDHTLMRYLRDRKGQQQFPELRYLPLIEHQNELEAIFDELVHKDGPLDAPNQNWGTRLAWQAEFASQPLTERLYSLGRLDG